MRLPRRALAALATAGVAVILSVPIVAVAADPAPSASPSPAAPSASQCPPGPLQKLCEVANAPGNAVGNAVQFGTDQAVVAVTKWVAGGASNLIGEIAKGLDSTAKPDLTQKWFLDHYRTMVYIGGLLMLPFLLASVIQGVIRQNVAQIVKSAFLYVPLAVFITGIAVTVVGWSVEASDGMTQMVSQGMGNDLTTFLTKVGTVYVPTQIVAAESGSAGVPLFIIFIGALVTAFAGFLIFLELLIRDAAIYVAVLFLPLVFAGMVWPAAAPWSKRLVETIAAIILSKFVIVAVLSLAAAGLAATGDQGQFQLLLVGSVLFLLAAFAPYTLFRLIPTLETAAIHQFQGMGQRGVSAVSPSSSPSSIYSRIMQSGSSGDTSSVPVASEGRQLVGAGASAGGGGAAAGAAEGGAAAAGGPIAAGAVMAADATGKAASAVKDAGEHRLASPASIPAGGGSAGPASSPPVPTPTDHGSPEV
jgi:type IV secretion system protein TrbL